MGLGSQTNITYRKETASINSKDTRLLRFVVCHHFIFPVTRVHGPFHLQTAEERCIPCSLIVRFLSDPEDVVNRGQDTAQRTPLPVIRR